MDEALKLLIDFAAKHLNKFILVILIIGSFICPASLFIFFYGRAEFTLMTASKLIILSLGLTLPIFFLGFAMLFIIVHFNNDFRNKIEERLRSLNFKVKVGRKKVIDVFTPMTIFVSLLTILLFLIPIVILFFTGVAEIKSGLVFLYIVFFSLYIGIMLYVIFRSFLPGLLFILSIPLAEELLIQKLVFEKILYVILIIMIIIEVIIHRKAYQKN